MAERDLLVRILGDDRDLQRTFRTSTAGTRKFGVEMDAATSRTQKFNQALRGGLSGFGSRSSLLFGSGAFVATAALSTALRGSVDAASDLNEELSKAREIFGTSSTEIERWSRTTANAFGIARSEALGAAAGFGQILQTSGVVQSEAANMSRALVDLAGDIASFNNLNTDEALLKLRAGLVGEAEPLRTVGVLLSEARVKQEAYAAGIARTGEELTDQQKVLARYRIILEDTAAAQGDAARTGDQAAGQLRRLKANVRDLEAALGTLLLPVLAETAGALNDIVVAAGKAGDALDRLGSVKIPGVGVELRDIADAGLELFKRTNPVTGSILLWSDAVDVLGLSARGAAKEVQGLTHAVTGIPSRGAVGRGKERQAAQAATGSVFAGIDALLAGAKRAASVAQEASEKGQVMLDAAEQVKRQREAFDRLLESLDIASTRADLTATLKDDLKNLNDQQAAVLAQIRVEGRTLGLERELVRIATERQDVRREQARRTAEAARQAREQAAANRQSLQFRTLGLTADGGERVPGTDALRRRLGNVRDAIRGTTLDTDRTQQQLRRIAKVLSGAFGKVGRDVRSSIDQMFDDIRAALDQGDKKITGPLTKTTALNTKKLLEGLGLSAEEINALRGRLSSFNSAGVAPGGFLSPGLPNRNLPTGFAVPVVVESNVTVTLDGEKVGKSVTRQQQKARRRNPQQKRGPNRIGGL